MNASALASLRNGRSALRVSQHIRHLHHGGSSSERPFRMAVIGSGPAGFYSAHRVMTRIPDGMVDMYEQLPVPFGLVRFGVAPDHPEVKNCQDKFREIAESPRFNFVGNVNVGNDIPLAELRAQYDAVLFAYGASKDRELNIAGEKLEGIYSARAFVGWYNGLPEYASLSPALESGDRAVIIGQGNVALDVARILLSGVDRLRKTDISEQALDQLSRSRIKNVSITGRRGPMQAPFTIKEVRELMQLPDVNFLPIDTSLLPDEKKITLPRTKKRMTELFKKHAATRDKVEAASRSRSVAFDFFRDPVAFLPDESWNGRLSSILFCRTVLNPNHDPFHSRASIVATQAPFEVDANVAFRSIGYKAEPLKGMSDLGIAFDEKKGIIPNLGGRVLRGNDHIPGLYCSGWVKRGPTGVIATTMEDGFATAESVAEDWQGKAGGKPGFEALKSRLPGATTFQDWMKIDAAERERGRAVGKEREKFKSISEMLNVIG